VGKEDGLLWGKGGGELGIAECREKGKKDEPQVPTSGELRHVVAERKERERSGGGGKNRL